MFSRMLPSTLKACALLVLPVLFAAGVLLSVPSGFGPGPQNAEAALLIEVEKLIASDAAAWDSFGISVAISGDTAVVGAFRVDTAGQALDGGAAYIFQRNLGGEDNWGEVKKITASNASAYDRFGYSVAISGDTVVVGAPYGDFPPARTDGGVAYVFERDWPSANNWGEVRHLVAPGQPQQGDEFGYSVAISGDTAVVGAQGEGAADLSNAGAAYVFQRDDPAPNVWGPVKRITASDIQAGDFFGSSVAVSGDTAVVGAFSEDGGAGDPISSAGAAYVVQRDLGGTNNWGEVKRITAADPQENDQFGFSVAVSGDTAVVGAAKEDGGAGDPITDAGAAYVFQRNQGAPDNWGEVRKLFVFDAHPGDELGYSVAISGDTAVAGARYEDAGGTDAGAAHVFQRDQGAPDNWGEVKELTPSVAQAINYFGTSVAVSGDTAVAGAVFDDLDGTPSHTNAGAAYVFQEPDTPTITPTFTYTPTFTLTPTPTVTPTPTPTPCLEEGKVPADGGGCGTPTTTPTKQAFKGDTDGDGCSDVRENLPKAAVLFGGGRDYLNPWDWYDINQDSIIDLFTDIIGVIQHYSLDGAPPYDVIYDRGASAGPNPWNMTAPDGIIDLFVDILGVIGQYSLSGCT